MIESEYLLVDKESIANMHFPIEDVLMKDVEIKERNASIDRAISLGNLEHQKVFIYFSDDAGKKKVNTTIWAVTDSAIVLKQNVILPKTRIYKLEI